MAEEESSEIIQGWLDRIQAGEFDQPEQPTPVNQPDVEERHRAPF